MPILKSGLYIVSTPIGNLQDITLRAINTLQNVDRIYAEDKRIAQKLCASYDIKTPLSAYHDHNGAKLRPAIMRSLKEGERIALISDAGTPLISDPGYKLVEAAIHEEIAVIPIPGVSAPIAALSASGLPSDSFMFLGFAPVKSSQRRKFLEAHKASPVTLVLFESPRRLIDLLSDAKDIFHNRKCVVARELTKIYETYKRGTLSEVEAYYSETGPPKGEIVVLIEGQVGPGTVEQDELDAAIRRELITNSVKDTALKLSVSFNMPKKQIYNRALILKRKDVG